MTLSIEQWHTRYCEQARWTESLRAHFFSRPEIRRLRRILEVGCGTGAVSSSVDREVAAAEVTGVDVDLPRLAFARSHDPASDYAAGDGRQLPFPDGSFDLAYCHFLLLWIPSPLRAVCEMARVVRSGGWVAAWAEPDHSARIDFPPPLDELGRLQTEALRQQGADLALGRRLARLFIDAGLEIVETGILASQEIRINQSVAEADREWKILEEDIGRRLDATEWETYRRADADARRRGERVLFIPTFYCLARK